MSPPADLGRVVIPPGTEDPPIPEAPMRLVGLSLLGKELAQVDGLVEPTAVGIRPRVPSPEAGRGSGIITESSLLVPKSATSKEQFDPVTGMGLEHCQLKLVTACMHITQSNCSKSNKHKHNPCPSILTVSSHQAEAHINVHH
jgi:hypothetical protein